MLGDTDPDVKELQRVLNSSVDTIVTLNADDVGSLGNEGTYFGPLTKVAVIKFQNKYRDSILIPNGLTAGTGNLDKLTRTKLNLLLGVMTTSDSVGLPQNRPSRLAQTVIPATTIIAPVDNTNSSTCRFTEVLISIGVIPTNKIEAARNLFHCSAPVLGSTPFVDLKINGQSGLIYISSARDVTLAWNSANVTSCQTSAGSKPLSGSQSVRVSSSGSYSITCTGPLGTVSDSVLVEFGTSNSGDLSVTCEASPATTTINTPVIWQADADGGNDNYRYEWAGAVDGASRYVSKIYSNPGRKVSYVRVTSGSLSATADCEAFISSSSVVDSSSKTITYFGFATPAVSGAINESAGTITVVVPNGTNVTALVPVIQGSGAQLVPASGVAKNFTSPVTYTVTAVDGTTKTYVVTVTNPSVSDKAITSFTLANPVSSGVINEVAHTVTLPIPLNTSVVSLIPTIVITGASVSPASGVARNFTNPVVYTVTATNGSTQDYTVTATTTATSTTLAVSCEAKPLSAVVGKQISWKAKVSGGTGDYKYKWSGDGLSGSNSTLAKTYSSVGAKEAHLTVTSGTQTGKANCAVAIFSEDKPNQVSSSTPEARSNNNGNSSPYSPAQSGQCTPSSGSGSGISAGIGYNSQTGFSAGVTGGFSNPMQDQSGFGLPPCPQEENPFSGMPSGSPGSDPSSNPGSNPNGSQSPFPQPDPNNNQEDPQEAFFGGVITRIDKCEGWTGGILGYRDDWRVVSIEQCPDISTTTRQMDLTAGVGYVIFPKNSIQTMKVGSTTIGWATKGNDAESLCHNDAPTAKNFNIGLPLDFLGQVLRYQSAGGSCASLNVASTTASSTASTTPMGDPLVPPPVPAEENPFGNFIQTSGRWEGDNYVFDSPAQPAAPRTWNSWSQQMHETGSYDPNSPNVQVPYAPVPYRQAVW